MTASNETQTASRADLHCHSTASQDSKLGVQRALGLPECATPPEEVYALAKRRGMDFVTITDHDTIDGVLQIADRPDVFVSEELTARFRGEPQAVHVLCYGITPDDHEWLQAHADDVEVCAAYLHEHEIACALAHPYYAVDGAADRAPPPPPGRAVRRSGRSATAPARPSSTARPRSTSTPTAASASAAPTTTPASTSAAPGPQTPAARDAAGVPRPRARRPRAARTASRAAPRSGRTRRSRSRCARSAAATRDRARPTRRAVLRMVERVMTRGRRAQRRDRPADLGPEDARGLLRAWLARSSSTSSERELIAHMQADGFSHADLYRRACRATSASSQARGRRRVGRRERAGDAAARPPRRSVRGLHRRRSPTRPRPPSWPRAGASSAARDARARRASRWSPTASARRTASRARSRRSASAACPGFEVEVIGTDPHVDRRLRAVAEIERALLPRRCSRRAEPARPSSRRSPRAATTSLHVCSPGPAGIAAALIGRAARAAAARLLPHRAGRLRRRCAPATRALAAAHASSRSAPSTARCDAVLSPSPGLRRRARARSASRAERIAALGPRRRHRALLARRCARRARPTGRASTCSTPGRLTREKGVDLLADAFLRGARARPAPAPRARRRRPRGGRAARARSATRATFLGWLEGDALAQAYASADLFLFCSQTDTFGQVVLEAQASGLPVVAVAEGGPAELIAHGRSGLLCPPDPRAARRSRSPAWPAPPRRAGGSPAAACGPSKSAPGRLR